jgi:hypothetical protein
VEGRRVIDGPAADWLTRNRNGLNQRIRLARHQGGRPDSALLSAWLHRLLPQLCAKQAGDAVIQAAFDLVLLLAAQSRLPAIALAGSDAQGRLLDTVPELAPALNARPELLAAFSNAAGNLGSSGLAFAAALPALAAACPVERLLEAGAVLAWRLGEPRLRQRALAIAATLPSAAAAVALDVPGPQLAEAIAQLNANAWRRPGRPGLAQIGDFTGFGGPFAVPPLLLGSSQGHGLHVQCGAVRHRIIADTFGWRCLPDADPAGIVAKAKVPVAAKPLIAGCSSWVLLQPGVLACTRPDSFRIRIVEPG